MASFVAPASTKWDLLNGLLTGLTPTKAFRAASLTPNFGAKYSRPKYSIKTVAGGAGIALIRNTPTTTCP
jgi:hypothetical protein